MTTWYRASRYKKLQTFSGEGGLHTYGRWNHAGRKVIYCSESIALCTLEWLAHNGLSVSSFNYFKYSIKIPKDLILEFTIDDLPSGWNTTPSNDLTRDFAEQYLFSATKYLALKVPSVIVPEEFNLIINVMHTEFDTAFNTIQSLGEFIAPGR